MSLTTPSIFSSAVPPSLSGAPSEFPLSSLISGEGGVSTSALVAFPISIQPGAGNTPGSNLIIQAQNMGQPFLLTPTPNDKQTASLMPPTSSAAYPTTMKDLEQLKLQYDKIYQQISETLQHQEYQTSKHTENNKEGISDASSDNDHKRSRESHSPPPSSEELDLANKRPRNDGL